MTQPCKYYVAGAGYCSAKKELKFVSLYCQDMRKADKMCEGDYAERLQEFRRTQDSDFGFVY